MESKELLTIAKEIYTNNTKDGSFTLGAGCYNKKNHSYVYFWLFIDEIEDEHLLYVMKCSKISFLSLNDSYFPISELKEEIKKDIERKKEMYPRTLEEIAIDLYDRIERYNGGLDTTFAGIIFDKNSLEIGLANDFYTQNCYGDVVYKYKWEYINRKLEVKRFDPNDSTEDLLLEKEAFLASFLQDKVKERLKEKNERINRM